MINEMKIAIVLVHLQMRLFNCEISTIVQEEVKSSLCTSSLRIVISIAHHSKKKGKSIYCQYLPN